MFTIHYKGSFIHGYCDRAACRVSGEFVGSFKSMRAAKCAITRKKGGN
ncbi:hypothetical protein QTI33_32225 [Variovorax sp. J22P271]|nr:hypothetical protein [Variovorax sp. J22P271]MDM0036841.1 hypothetical protein [Variovorax sp. J22P271]